jgi:proteasome accessory factor BC
MASSRTERLLALALVLLNSARPLTRSEIRDAVLDYPAEATQVAFERMFERDKEELRTMGIPVETVETDGPEGLGYQLEQDEAFLAPVNATDDEKFVLALASRIWQEATWSHAATTALRKLELVGGFQSEAQGTFAFSVPVDSTLLTQALAAAHNRQVVSFEYRTADESAPATRRLQPWGVVAARGQWYLVGHDLDRDAQRAFRMSRFTSTLSTKAKRDAFEPPADVDLRSLVTASFPPTSVQDVVIRLAPGRGASLRAAATPQDAGQQPTGADLDGDKRDSDNTVRFVGSNTELLIPEILRAGDAAEVLEPDGIRHLVAERLGAMARRDSPTVDAATMAILAKDVARQHKITPETSNDQLGRLLALVPWLQANPGVTYEQAADRFGVDVPRLQSDLVLASCTEFGSHLLTLDIDIWGTTIYVRDSQGIGTPLQFTQPEVVSLLIGLDLLTQVPGPHDITAIATISEKLRAVAGDAARLTQGLSVDGQLTASTTIDSRIVESVSDALARGLALDVTYLSASSDSESHRVVDPMGLVTTQGAEYLQAWCRSADAVRLFRLDRIRSALVLPEDSHVPEQAGPLRSGIDPEGEMTLIAVAPSASWWIDQVPHEGTAHMDSGETLVQLQVANEQWGVRTVLGFGGALTAISPESFVTAVREAAESASALYS